MRSYRETAWALYQNGRLDEAVTAWTLENLDQIAKGNAPDPVVLENLHLAGKGLVKDGFTRDNDESLLHHLIGLQKRIGNRDDLRNAIDTLLTEWRASPETHLYPWAIDQMRATRGPQDRVLVLAAIGQFLEQAVEQARHAPEIGTTLRTRVG